MKNVQRHVIDRWGKTYCQSLEHGWPCIWLNGYPGSSPRCRLRQHPVRLGETSLPVRLNVCRETGTEMRLVVEVGPTNLPPMVDGRTADLLVRLSRLRGEYLDAALDSCEVAVDREAALQSQGKVDCVVGAPADRRA